MKTSTLWLIAGILAFIAGAVALANPLGATITATLLAGWGFLMIGVLQIILALTLPKDSGKIWAILWSLVVVYIGISLLWNPLKGMIVITLAIGLLMLASGVMRVVTSLALRGTNMFLPMLISGLLSFGLGAYVLLNFQGASAVLPGVLLGVELLFNGVGLISMSSHAKRLEAATGIN